MRKFSVITLNWNGLDVLPEMIDSLSDQLVALHGNLVVFDNNSTDGSDRLVQNKWGGESWFSLVKSEKNLGFAGGANQAIRDTESEVIVLANSDTVFLPDSLRCLLEALERYPDAGVIGPKLLWPDGTLQRSLRDFPFPHALLMEHLPVLKRRTALHQPHTIEQQVDWLVGAVMVFRKKLFEDVGGFDESFFFYHEETELQYRLTQQGHPSVFIPSAAVVHVEGASARAMFGKATYIKYIQAKMAFLDKHAGAGSLLFFRLFMGFLQVYRLVAGILNPELAERDIRYSGLYCRKAIGELLNRNRQGGS